MKTSLHRKQRHAINFVGQAVLSTPPGGKIIEIPGGEIHVNLTPRVGKIIVSPGGETVLWPQTCLRENDMNRCEKACIFEFFTTNFESYMCCGPMSCTEFSLRFSCPSCFHLKNFYESLVHKNTHMCTRSTQNAKTESVLFLDKSQIQKKGAK